MALDRDRKRYTLGHVGDSRAYLFRAGVLSQLTTHDTCVQARVDASELTPEQARHHPYSHVLTQCVGLEDEPAPHIRREHARSFRYSQTPNPPSAETGPPLPPLRILAELAGRPSRWGSQASQRAARSL